MNDIVRTDELEALARQGKAIFECFGYPDSLKKQCTVGTIVYKEISPGVWKKQ